MKRAEISHLSINILILGFFFLLLHSQIVILNFINIEPIIGPLEKYLFVFK